MGLHLRDVEFKLKENYGLNNQWWRDMCAILYNQEEYFDWINTQKLHLLSCVLHLDILKFK